MSAIPKRGARGDFAGDWIAQAPKFANEKIQAEPFKKVLFTLPESELNALDALALELGFTRSALLRTGIEALRLLPEEMRTGLLSELPAGARTPR